MLVVGAGGGGMTAALAAQAAGLDTLLVEKAPRFGGSTALSGGGIWVPGARVQVETGDRPDPEAVIDYLKTITEGIVPEARLRAYVETAPAMLDFVAEHTDAELVWKPGYPDYFPEVPGGSPEGSVINVEPIDLRRLGEDEEKLLKPAAVGPRGMWLRPLELRSFYTIRQSWRGKVVLLRFLWRALRARVLGERIAAMGQALTAHLWLGLRRLGVTAWLDSPLQALISAEDGTVRGAVIRHEGRDLRVGARGGVVLATGGFEHNAEMRREHQPFVAGGLQPRQPRQHGRRDPRRPGRRRRRRADGRGVVVPDARVAGRPAPHDAQRADDARAVHRQRRRRALHQRGDALLGVRARDDRGAGVGHDVHAVLADHRPALLGALRDRRAPAAPAHPVRPGADGRRDGRGVAAGRRRQAGPHLGRARGGDRRPADALERTARRYDEVAATGHDDDFGRGESAYDRYYGDPTLPNPNLDPFAGAAVLRVPDRAGRPRAPRAGC